MFIGLSNTNPIPLYEQIKQQIAEQIMNGRLLPGTMLPSIRLLAKELEVSVITVKKAYEGLEAAGYAAGLEIIKETRLKEVERHFEAGIEQCQSLGLTEVEIGKFFHIILDEKPRPN